jgi:hypothetical protein
MSKCCAPKISRAIGDLVHLFSFKGAWWTRATAGLNAGRSADIRRAWSREASPNRKEWRAAFARGCFKRTLLPPIAPPEAFVEPPTAPALDPGRIVPLPLMLGQLPTTIARAAVLAALAGSARRLAESEAMQQLRLL